MKMRTIFSQEDLKNSYVRIKKKDIEKLVAAAEKAYNGFYFATTKQFISNMKHLLKTVDFNKEVIVYREGV